MKPLNILVGFVVILIAILALIYFVLPMFKEFDLGALPF